MTNKSNWFEKVSKKNKLHFDKRKKYPVACSIIDSDSVAKHKFFPFINFTIKAFQYSKLKELKRQGITSIPKELLFKPREINYSCYSDSYILAYYNEKLAKTYENILKIKHISAPIAYISIKKANGKGKNNVDFAAEAFTEIKQRKNCFCIGLDIKGFFDNLDHKRLKYSLIKIIGTDDQKLTSDWYLIYKILTKFHFISLKELLKVLKKDKNDFWEKGKGFDAICTPKEFRDLIHTHTKLIKSNKTIKDNIEGENKRGIPQGINISGLLANIYMLDFDIELEKFLKDFDGYYRRYSDDIMIIVNNKKEMELALNKVKQLIGEFKLEIAKKKTSIIEFNNGNAKIYSSDLISSNNNENALQYLGFTYDGKNIRVRDSTIGKFWRDAKPHIRRMIITSLIMEKTIPKGKIYGLYSHLKNRPKKSNNKKAINFCGNFYSYIRNADKKLRQEYNFQQEVKIKKQLRNAWQQLNEYIEEVEQDYIEKPNKYKWIKSRIEKNIATNDCNK